MVVKSTALRTQVNTRFMVALLSLGFIPCLIHRTDKPARFPKLEYVRPRGAPSADAVIGAIASRTSSNRTRDAIIRSIIASAMADPADAEDHVGASFSVGEFNGDGLDDVAIGVPQESVGVKEHAGA